MTVALAIAAIQGQVETQLAPSRPRRAVPTARVYHSGAALYRFGWVDEVSVEIRRPESARVWSDAEIDAAQAEVRSLLEWLRRNERDIGGMTVYWRDRPTVEFSTDANEAMARIRIRLCVEYPRG